MDAFADLEILLPGEKSGENTPISIGLNEQLQFRVTIKDPEFQELLKKSLNIYLDTSHANWTESPIVGTTLYDGLDQLILKEISFKSPAKVKNPYGPCSTYYLTASLNSKTLGYEVVGNYKKERKITICLPSTAKPTVSPTLAPIFSPTAEVINIIPLTIADVPKNTPTGSGPDSGNIASCSNDFLEKIIKIAVRAIPFAGLAPVAISLLNTTSAFFTSDRRRPEHWVKVIDAATGKPVGGAIINVLSADGKSLATWTSDPKTGNTGDLLQPGQYSFVVQKSGYIFPSVEEPMFPMQSGEFIYRSGLVTFNHSNMDING